MHPNAAKKRERTKKKKASEQTDVPGSEARPGDEEGYVTKEGHGERSGGSESERNDAGNIYIQRCN